MDNATEKNTTEGETKRARNQEWRRKMKELKKQKKEEEIRKNLMSRDSKVVVIDKATFESFNKKSGVGRVEKSNAGSSSISSNDFPELRGPPQKNTEGNEIEQGRKSRKKVSHLSQSSWCWQPIVETLKNENSKDSFPSLESTFNRNRKKPQGNVQDILGESSTEPTQILRHDVVRQDDDAQKIEKQKLIPQKSKNLPQSSGKNLKKKKHKDPVVLNLKEVLIDKKSAKKDNKRVQVLGSKFRRRTEKEILSGNILDSSNPRRNRGKHREIKKKKLSNLKLAIIKERIIKSKTKEKAVELAFKNTDVNLNEEIDFKIEVEKYLESLNARKNERKMNERKNAGKKKKNETLEAAKPGDSVQASARPTALRFSSKFREYCSNILTPSLDASVAELIKEIIYLQDRMFARDPIKAHAKKRHVTGFREVRKYLTLKKVKIIVIAPDLEKSESKDSIFDLVYELKEAAALQNVPCIFALDRRKLGYLTKKKVPISAFAILNFEGAEARLEAVMENYAEAKKCFEELTSEPEIEEVFTTVPVESTVTDLADQLASAFITALTENPGLSKKESDSEDESNPFLKALKNCDKKT